VIKKATPEDAQSLLRDLAKGNGPHREYAIAALSTTEQGQMK
jgi:hypothetical protein